MQGTDVSETADWPAGQAHSRTSFSLFLCTLVALELVYFSDALRPGYVLSAADWLLASESYRETGPDYEPTNRLLTDIACQMDAWLDVAATEWQAGRVPLWNPYAGCGAPLLANAQSGVLNPVNGIYFLSRSPHAFVMMAMVKLFIAGAGAYLLARELGLGLAGCWFAGLCFPFSGFVIVWLQYPMGGVAVWLPLVIWQVERLQRRAGAGRAAGLAILLTVLHLAGHPETTAHILLVATAVIAWRGWSRWQRGDRIADVVGWYAGAVVVSMLAGAVQLLPTAEYLARGEAWFERSAERPGILHFRSPRILATPALAAPYVYGSHRRGHPHVEKAIGVENFNELAGGYTGLFSLLVLVPMAFQTRHRHAWIPFWFAVDLFCLAAAYRIPVVDNLLRAVPVVNAIQQERALLIVSLAHCLLGGAAVDCWPQLAASPVRRFRIGLGVMILAVGSVFGVAALGVRWAEPVIERKSQAHFAEQARLRGLPQGAFDYRAREMAVRVTQFFPRYYGVVAGYAALIAVGLFFRLPSGLAWRTGLIVVCVAELFVFGRNYNPAISIDKYFPSSGVTRFLQASAGLGSGRVLSLEEEFPPNVLTRYRVSDIRNYDAIEVRRSLDFFEPLWPAEQGRRTSNSWTSWQQVHESRDRLRLANVRYVISTSPPAGYSEPPAVFGKVYVQPISDAVTPVFSLPAGVRDIAHAEPAELIDVDYRAGHFHATVNIRDGHDLLVLSETFMPGWRARIDDRLVEASAYHGAWLSVAITPGRHRVQFDYVPVSFRAGLFLSVLGLAVIAVVVQASRLQSRHCGAGVPPAKS